MKDAVEQNPELTGAEKQKVLENMTTILLASNRRVDITLSTTGQQSLRQYPFNVADSLSLLSQQEARKSRSQRKKPGQRWNSVGVLARARIGGERGI